MSDGMTLIIFMTRAWQMRRLAVGTALILALYRLCINRGFE
jgi:hypothetical protein